MTTWYAIESSRSGDDEWVRHGATTWGNVPTSELSRLRDNHKAYDFRVVQIIQTETVVAA